MSKINKLLAANRSEIATRIFRSATELHIRTVAIYTYEDRYALHRFKADEAYCIGQPGEPIRAYLNIDGILQVAKANHVDAIHPGYGFLSENPEFARKCRAAGIEFLGPQVSTLEILGDKTSARQIAQQVGIPVLNGSDEAIKSLKEGKQVAESLGFPVILKASHGGGGRGMRIVNKTEEFPSAFEQAQRESITAFGSPDIFIEKFITRARHIEVQLLGDKHENLVHLYERDCSVQRRHQKVVEIAPAPCLDSQVRDQLLEAALAIGKAVNYQSAGTVEFLVDADTQKFYFIEVNPRIQVEHTVTEEITGIDIVRSQILVAEGSQLSDPLIGIPNQASVVPNGFALQARVTTEDPSNNFMPDYGRVTHYRSASGMGVRLDAGSAHSGAVVHPYYDSLLVKVTTRGRTFPDAVSRLDRCLQEFRIRGVKTNIGFILSLIRHETFRQGTCHTRFIDETPELFVFPKLQNRTTRLLRYLGDVIVNGNPLVKDRHRALRREAAPVPSYDNQNEIPPGTRTKLLEWGAEKFSQWVRSEKRLFITDTSFRDAHQSLLATRFRTHDLLQISEAYAYLASNLFSLEMWGGATFDTSMRFLKESPWNRLIQMREKIPNILFQMLLRASNAVGYTNYPDNVVKAFVKEAASAGMDLFRIFDALNWTENMKVAMEAVRETDALCEASICYTGDILNPKKSKYDLKYYVNLAKELEKMGAHILAIKDMAGLCKPAAAKKLVETLRQEIGIPIHFHTHDTAGIQSAAIFEAAKVGLDIADVAMAPLSGGTSQPNLNTMVESFRFTDRDTELDSDVLDQLAGYWRAVRSFYTAFESPMLPATADLYSHEMPGGQYTNLYQQAVALGLADRWREVCQVYADVNQMFGDIVKVTPTSKSVGDMALFMVANHLETADVLDTSRDLAFPQSVIDLISGRMGQPYQGFPQEVKDRILQNVDEFTQRPGITLPEVDFEKTAEEVKSFLHREPHQQEILSYVLYPKVYREFADHLECFSDTSSLPTWVFFYGLQPGEEIAVQIEQGKTLIIHYSTFGEANKEGLRTVFFEVNGQPRSITINDHSLEAETKANLKANPDNPREVGASMPGMVVDIAVESGDLISKGEKLLTLEAMKMETTIFAEQDGKIEEIFAAVGNQVDVGDLLLTFE